MRRRSALFALVLLVGVGLAACGGGDDDATTAGAPTTAAAAESTTIAATGSDATGTTAGTEAGPTTTTATTAPAATDPADLPGEVIDIYPYEGAALAVVGVADDDTLNVRTGPGTEFDVAFELAPLADGFTATGSNRSLDDASFWAEVARDGETGWANVLYLAQLGAPRDVTDDVTVATEGASAAEIATDVAGQLAPAGEGPTPPVTVVDEPSATEATVDVIGLADDAQKGLRVHVIVAGGAVTVEATDLCARGVSDGLCS